jgi:two-component system, cell cycle sensor histidine kinase and response regulator CckA
MSANDKWYRRIVDAVPEGIWIVNPEGQTIFCNERMAELLGTDIETLYRRSCFDPVFPEDLEDAQRRFTLQMEGSREPFDFRLRRTDGSPIWVSISCKPMYDDGGICIGLLGLFTDISRRRQEESDLRYRERLFRAIFSQAAVGIAQTGPDGRWLLLNDRFCEFIGYSQEELGGKTFLDITHPDDREASLAAVRRLLSGESSSCQIDKRYIRKNGIPVWARLFLSLVRDQLNQPQYFISIVEDITEQKLAEERLQASRIQLMDAQRLANLGSWEREIATEQIHWSDEMHRISGLPTAPQTLSDYLETVHPRDREEVREAAGKTRSSSSPQVLSYRVVRPDGEVRLVRSIVEAIRDQEGNVTRLVGAVQDITEQFEVEERLRTSEERLKNAERLAHLGHWQWNLRTNRVSGSDEMYRIFGKAPDYVPSYQGFLADLMPEDRDRLEELVEDSLARKVGHSIEYRILLSSGERRTISCIWEVLTDEDGIPVRLFGTCQDITESRRAQEESFAKQKLESIGMLASGIAHDFNNLLGSVLALAELALGELAARSSPEEELKAIRDVAIRGSEMVRQLMIYAGKEKEPVALIDASQIVLEMVDLLKVSVSKHATLEIDLGQNLPAIKASPAQFRQIVMNLVMNASEAIGDQEGVIRVATKYVTISGTIEIPKGMAQGDYVQLEISDTGCGMSSETQARMFDPFFTTKSAGHGLGLVIVDSIVRGLGGTVDVTSAVGKGTTWRLSFPCAKAVTAATSDSAPLPGVDTRSGEAFTVLIVEDEDALREATARMLRNLGVTVLKAANGSVAIDLLHRYASKIDVILLDATIPGASSNEVVAEAAQVHSDTKVILTSAYGEEMLEHFENAPQICGFIRKPFQLSSLIETIRTILRKNEESSQSGSSA